MDKKLYNWFLDVVFYWMFISIDPTGMSNFVGGSRVQTSPEVVQEIVPLAMPDSILYVYIN